MRETLREFGQLLRELRTKTGQSQAEIAKMLGITRSAYTYYESGKTLPNLTNIRKLAEIFQVPVEMLVYPERYLQK